MCFVMLMFSSQNPSGYLILFYLCLMWTGLSVMASNSTNWLNKSETQTSDISQAVTVLKKVMGNLSSYLGNMDTAAVSSAPPKCLKVQCRIICFNGRQSEIVKDIKNALLDDSSCIVIDELHLYNYNFLNAVVPVGFLGEFTDKVKLIYIGISNITAIESGAFGNGIFKKIMLEDLQLVKLDKAFFTNITHYFKGISIMQDKVPLQNVYPDFLDIVQFQIQYLRLRTGITCVRNLTATDPILAAVTNADFSYNNFGDELLDDSFRKLTMLEKLILSNSNISYLPHYIFQDMKYLELLDISNNKLMTISKIIFGISDISTNLVVIAEDNNWHCDCALQIEMNEIFKYQSLKYDLLCSTPEQYQNYFVFDERICNIMEEEGTTVGYSTTTTSKTTTTYSTELITTSTTVATSTTDQIIFVPTISTAGTVKPSEIVPLECTVSNQTKSQNIRWPQIYFFPREFGALTVKISVDQRDSSSSFGIFWFSKTTKEFYMMEMLPDEFGLGCYFTMPLQSIVTQLVPNVAYTFCLVDDNQNAVSPFSCKSVHIGSNLNTHYATWLSRRVRAKGISVMVLGVILFMFIGIATVFLVLKQKPMLLKGSKRVIMPKFKSGEVVVLPRSDTAEYLNHKESMISRLNAQRSISFISRKNSVESLASSDSYMDTNLYEIIPTYISFDKVPEVEAPSHPGSEILDIYQSPVRSTDDDKSDTGSVRYAQITPRTKRISSDPLPAIPSDVSDVPH
ncbi:uncharacterized protein LOC132793932 [Drosophila nasuta]|uniref:uncharacterized protein LOC132793932 n=1 Tax=Drosophila nasuta TaxID=42062 RepID=UPI00295E6A17|nr:uncharacterized protein LOC132793932 [Drosophila nasuta]